MYLVTRLSTSFSTNIGDVSVLDDKELCGYILVFKRKKDAIKYATKSEPFAQVMKLSAKKTNKR